MGILAWLVIALFIIAVVLVVLLVTGRFRRFQPPTPPSAAAMTAAMYPTNPWGWSGNVTAVPVDGIDGKCNVYTFLPTGQFTPGMVSFSSIQSCNDGCTALQGCPCSTPLPGQTCVDDDQLFARKMKHKCEANPGWDVRLTGTCRQQNGQLVPPGTIEEYFTPCTPNPPATGPPPTSNRCFGSIGLITFNANIQNPGPSALTGALCLQDPNWTATLNPQGQLVVTNVSPLTANACDMRVERNNFPRQLFRVERADFDGTSFTPDQQGSYARIIHRPSGYVVGPTFSFDAFGNPQVGHPQLGQPLTLWNAGVSESGGYWWLLQPQTNNPNNVPGSGSWVIGRPQLVYVPDPTLVPSLSDANDLWTWLSSAYAVTPSSATPGSEVILGPYLTTNVLAPNTGGTDPQAASKLASTQFFDAAILGLILASPQNFDFNGPFTPLPS